MKTMIIRLETQNAAFEGPYGQVEAARILRELAEKIEFGHEPSRIFDINGNAACTIQYEDHISLEEWDVYEYEVGGNYEDGYKVLGETLVQRINVKEEAEDQDFIDALIIAGRLHGGLTEQDFIFNFEGEDVWSIYDADDNKPIYELRKV
ncbi:hypothetical protein [Paenibacillus xylanexedens]|uniref:hypothetical protein n=1 Tax=Paenibacillus xylanexedens TaxID=528191 RepID=UPI0011A6664E|nr:hypothetical protein [Paenibacillus xylanexedens]